MLVVPHESHLLVRMFQDYIKPTGETQHYYMNTITLFQ